MRRATLIVTLLGLWAAVPAAAQDPAPLVLGDDAPVIDVVEWVQGEPLTVFEPGKIYVFEFWATRSRQSQAALAGLSDLQERFRDQGVTIVGVTHEDSETVKEFLEMIELLRSADMAFTNLEMLFHDYEPFPMHESGGTYQGAAEFLREGPPSFARPPKHVLADIERFMKSLA